MGRYTSPRSLPHEEAKRTSRLWPFKQSLAIPPFWPILEPVKIAVPLVLLALVGVYIAFIKPP